MYGRTCSSTSGSAPTITDSAPASAAARVRATGASMKVTPRSPKRSASSRVEATGEVLVSTMICPRLTQSRSPPSASATSRTTSPEGSARKTTLDPSTTSRSWVQGCTPCSRRRSSGAGSRSNARTRAPDFCTRLRHIGSPMTPRPMKPSCVVSAAILNVLLIGLSASRDVDRLRLLVQAHAPDALLAPQPAFLEAAERRRDGQLLVGVDPHRPGGERPRDPPGPGEVPRPDAGGEPVHAVVCLGDEVRLVLEG